MALDDIPLTRCSTKFHIIGQRFDLDYNFFEIYQSPLNILVCLEKLHTFIITPTSLSKHACLKGLFSIYSDGERLCLNNTFLLLWVKQNFI